MKKDNASLSTKEHQNLGREIPHLCTRLLRKLNVPYMMTFLVRMAGKSQLEQSTIIVSLAAYSAHFATSPDLINTSPQSPVA